MTSTGMLGNRSLLKALKTVASKFFGEVMTSKVSKVSGAAFIISWRVASANEKRVLLKKYGSMIVIFETISPLSTNSFSLMNSMTCFSSRL